MDYQGHTQSSENTGNFVPNNYPEQVIINPEHDLTGIGNTAISNNGNATPMSAEMDGGIPMQAGMNPMGGMQMQAEAAPMQTMNAMPAMGPVPMEAQVQMQPQVHGQPQFDLNMQPGVVTQEQMNQMAAAGMIPREFGADRSEDIKIVGNKLNASGIKEVDDMINGFRSGSISPNELVEQASKMTEKALENSFGRKIGDN